MVEGKRKRLLGKPGVRELKKRTVRLRRRPLEIAKTGKMPGYPH
jgi:hypothetical protein